MTSQSYAPTRTFDVFYELRSPALKREIRRKDPGFGDFRQRSSEFGLDFPLLKSPLPIFRTYLPAPYYRSTGHTWGGVPVFVRLVLPINGTYLGRTSPDLRERHKGPSRVRINRTYFGFQSDDGLADYRLTGHTCPGNSRVRDRRALPVRRDRVPESGASERD